MARRQVVRKQLSLDVQSLPPVLICQLRNLGNYCLHPRQQQVARLLGGLWLVVSPAACRRRFDVDPQALPVNEHLAIPLGRWLHTHF